MAVDLFDLELAGVIVAAAVVFGGIHLESLSHLLLFLAALADLGDDGLGDFGDFTHLEVSGDSDGPDGHCHEVVGVGAGGDVGVAADEVVIFLLGFMTTLLGQDKFGGFFALYFGVAGNSVVAGDLDLLSKVTVGPGPSYGSSEAGLLNIFIISCDKPIGLFGAGGLDGVVAGLADDCRPVRVLDDDGVLGVVGKNLSDV